MKPRGNIWFSILLLAAVWSCQQAGLGAASADDHRVATKTSPRTTTPNDESRFGTRTAARGGRIQVATPKRSKTTTTQRPVSTKATPVKKRQHGVLVYTTSTTTPVPDDEETKSLSQQVKDGKYGLIQELFSAQPSRPGILSYAPNKEVPRDSEKNLGGLKPEDIWLSEGHMLVLSGFNKDDDVWEPIDDYEAPPRQVKLPSDPSVPPPFLVQLQDGGPTGFVSSNKGFNPALRQPPQGNVRQGNGLQAPLPLPPFLPPQPPPNATLDEDDPSIYYPPPYDFSFQSEVSTPLPPGPLVPGIVLPPPPSFFAPQNKSSEPKLVVPGQVDPFDFAFSPPEERPAYYPPQRPTYEPPTQQRPAFDPPRPQRPTFAPPTTQRPTYEPPKQHHPAYQPPLPVEIAPSVQIDNQTNVVDDGYSVPGYPYKEPNVILHHHGSPLYYLPHYTNLTQIFPPEQQVMYEAPLLPARKRPSQFKTVVSSTPSPTAIHYTLPPERGVHVSIYTATAPEEPSKLNYFSSTKAPKVVSHEYFTTQRPAAVENTTRAPPHYYHHQHHTPKPITQEYFTTERPNKVLYVQELPPLATAPPVYAQDSFQPSLDYPYTTTPAPHYYRAPNQGGYFQYPPQSAPPSQHTQALTNILRNLLNPHYLVQQQQQRHPAHDHAYQQQQRFPSTTGNPIFHGLYTQDDAQYMDEQTKGLFNTFGSKVRQHTTPLPLHDDVRVNYRQPRPPPHPDAEFVEVPSFVSYQLPGHGRLGPSHFYYVSPRPPRHAPATRQRARRRPK